jgi:hypothetical protein
LAGDLRFSHVTMVFRRDFLTTHFDTDCYAADLRFGEDHFLVLRALQRGRFALAHPTQPVVLRRRHPSSLTVAAGAVTTEDEAAAREVFAQRLAFCDRLWRWLQDDDLIGDYGAAALRYFVADFTAHQSQYIPRAALWGGFWPWAQTAIPQADLRRAFYEMLVARHLEVLEQQLQGWPLYHRIPKAVQYQLKRYGLRVWLRARRDAQAPIPPDYAR